MRGWQQGGLAGHHSPFPLARSLLQDSVLGIWHLPNRHVLSTFKLVAPQCCKAEGQGAVCWGGFQEKPSEFPATSMSRARSQVVLSILRVTRGPWPTAVSCPCRYEEIQQAQEELGAGMAEVAEEARRALTAVERAHADLAERLSQVATLRQVSSA